MARASWTVWIESGSWLPHKEAIIPVISTQNAEVMALALDPDVSVYRIGRLVSLEQGLATRVIRLANSASIGALKRITTVNEAIVRVGTEAVRQINSGRVRRGAHGSHRRPLEEPRSLRSRDRHCGAAAAPG